MALVWVPDQPIRETVDVVAPSDGPVSTEPAQIQTTISTPADRKKDYIDKCLERLANEEISTIKRDRENELDTNMLWAGSPGIKFFGIGVNAKDLIPEEGQKNKTVAGIMAISGTLPQAMTLGSGYISQALLEATKGRFDYNVRLDAARGRKFSQSRQDQCSGEAERVGY